MIGRNMSGIDSYGNWPKPKAGAYVIRILSATNNQKDERLEVEFDFDEGEFEGYYKNLHERAKFWGGKFYKSYKEKALPFFKAFIEAVEASNEYTDGLVIGDYEDIDETKLPGKIVGMVVGEAEYMGNDGKKKIKLDTFNADLISVADIRSGNYKVPEFVPLEDSPRQGSGGVVDTTAGSDPGEIPDGFSQVDENGMPF